MPRRVLFEFLFQYFFRSSGTVRRYNSLGSVYAIRHSSLYIILCVTWWRHQIETFPAENSPHKGQWRGALVIFYLRLNKRLSKQPWGWWFETLSRPLWRHRSESHKICSHVQNPLFCLRNTFSVSLMYPCSSYLHYRNCDKTQWNTLHFGFVSVINIYIYIVLSIIIWVDNQRFRCRDTYQIYAWQSLGNRCFSDYEKLRKTERTILV